MTFHSANSRQSLEISLYVDYYVLTTGSLLQQKGPLSIFFNLIGSSANPADNLPRKQQEANACFATIPQQDGNIPEQTSVVQMRSCFHQLQNPPVQFVQCPNSTESSVVHFLGRCSPVIVPVGSPLRMTRLLVAPF